MDPISIVLGAGVGAGLTALAGRTREHRPEPAGLADLLGWAFLVDEGVMLLKDGALLAAFRYRGPDLQSATAAELDALHAHLNAALLPYADGWMFHADAVRTPAPGYAADRFPDPATAWIDAERRAAFAGLAAERPQFVTECLLAITYVPPRELYARAAKLFVQGAPKGVDWSHVVGEFRSALDALEARLATRLAVERLDSAELVTHCHRCLTGLAHRVAPPPFGAYLNTVLASQEVVGGFAPKVGEQHLRVVAIMGYPAATTPGRLDALNTLPVAYRWSSRFIPVGPQTAATLIRRHQQRWFMGRRGMGSFLRDVTGGRDAATQARREAREEAFFHDQDATRMALDAGQAFAENASGAVRYGFSTQTVLVMDPDPTVAERNARLVLTTLEDQGLTGRVETVNALDAFFGSLPGHGYPNLRKPLLSTANVVDLWPVTAVWPGHAHCPSPFFPNDAPPLMHVATNGATPFRLNLHAGDVGHTLVVGATGAGKSTLVGLIAAQWQRYAPTLGARTVIFDVGGSHWLLAKAVGGAHYELGAGRLDALAFQPLADIDRSEERAWAAGWLEMLLELQGVVVTPERRVRLDRALQLLAREPRAFRTLTELTVQCQDAELAAALTPYTVGGTYGRLLDASEDALDGAVSEVGQRSAERRGSTPPRYQVFELRHLLDLEDKVLVPVLLYLFRRVERALDGRPTLIVIEELWAPLMRTVFASRIKQWLLTLRKQNAAVVLVAHTPAQLDAVPAKQVLIESCPTKVLLPNPEAMTVSAARSYRDLGLNDRELALLARAVPKRDYYVKSPAGSRLVTLELGPVARAFLTAPDGMAPDALRRAVEALAAQHGPAWPAAWLDSLGLTPPESALASGPDVDATHTVHPDPYTPAWREEAIHA